MGVLSIVLLIIGICALIEGSFLLIFPNTTKGFIRYFAKNMTKNLKTWGIGEIIIAIILIILGLNL